MALLLTGFGKSWIYQLLPIVIEKLGRPKFSKAIIVIVSPLVALMDDQVKEAAKLGLCAAQLGAMIEKSWRGISALFLVAPNPGFSIQNGKLCWHQTYTKTTSSPLLLTRHTLHTNGEFAYTGLVINFNKLIYFDISSVRGGWASAYHKQTLCDLLMGTPMIKKIQTSATPWESKRLTIMPFQTLSTKQSEEAEFGITRLPMRFQKM